MSSPAFALHVAGFCSARANRRVARTMPACDSRYLTLSCPAKAGHPVATNADSYSTSPAITGSSACADDDNAVGACPLRPSSGHGLYLPATSKENASEDGGSRGDRCRLDRRFARGHLVAHGAGRQIAPVRHQAGPARRGNETLQAGERDARLSGHHQERKDFGGRSEEHTSEL